MFVHHPLARYHAAHTTSLARAYLPAEKLMSEALTPAYMFLINTWLVFMLDTTSAVFRVAISDAARKSLDNLVTTKRRNVAGKLDEAAREAMAERM